MRSIGEQITGKQPTLEEELYTFYGALVYDDEPEYQRLMASFKGRFDDNHFIPETQKDRFGISHFTFMPGYLRMDASFGEQFRQSIDELIIALKQANEDVLKTDCESKKEQVGRTRRQEIPQTTILFNETTEDGTWYFGSDCEEIKKIKSAGATKTPVAIQVTTNDPHDITCIVYAGKKPLFAYTIAPKSELEKEIRLSESYEQRTYNIAGTTNQLDMLEQAFAYLQMLGEEGHTSGIKICYDGDGNARMLFERADKKSLALPLSNLNFYKGIGKDRKKISPEEFLQLAKEHQSLSWIENGQRRHITYDFRDDENACTSVFEIY